MSDTLYYYADDGGSRADCDAVYLDADHSDLADADRVRATRHKPDGADVIGGGFGDDRTAIRSPTRPLPTSIGARAFHSLSRARPITYWMRYVNIPEAIRYARRPRGRP